MQMYTVQCTDNMLSAAAPLCALHNQQRVLAGNAFGIRVLVCLPCFCCQSELDVHSMYHIQECTSGGWRYRVVGKIIPCSLYAQWVGLRHVGTMQWYDTCACMVASIVACMVAWQCKCSAASHRAQPQWNTKGPVVIENIRHARATFIRPGPEMH